ncbi:FAD-binding protein [Caulobacter hibisci]|uniref:FAD-binding oxidoreductase n=1 Tax=Caulobacter hibisci TaxID=2035993 RepID=A0ABS0T7E4_9CAUL|nr:FAD-binding oxidoreductase [Caulobacter hibisci]MBI1686985.1 FAD-binding oxidoreductase [Caulobacter hibisci]
MSEAFSRRDAVGGALAGAALLATPARAAPATVEQATGGSAILDDASGLDATPVARHVRPAIDGGLVEALRRELKDAAAAGRPVCIGGARHSMGGQSLAQGGTAITFDRGGCAIDAARLTYRAHAGTRWRDIIPALDRLDFAPKVTQANNDFTLGGAFSVNVHGWAAPLGPMGSTVRSITLLMADGQLVRCSREVEPGLFALAMGGYGLFGVIVDLEVEMARNVRLKPAYEAMPAADFGPRFAKALHGPDVVMGYGRLSVSRRNFFQEALMTVFRRVEGAPERLSGKGDPMAGVVRGIYRAQIGSEPWKDLRWYAETVLKPSLEAKAVTRNALINSSADELADRNPRRTDILHEYFLPPDRLGGFLAACRDIIPKSGLDLLNVTLRYIAADRTSVMAFAPGERVAAVMSFSQARTLKADAAMKPVTQALIDAALAHGGSFYLPYRLHARPDQLARAYPGLPRFVAEKRRLDPGGLFRNTMWDRYFAEFA